MRNTLPHVLLACRDLAKYSFLKEAFKGSFSILHEEWAKAAIEWLVSSTVEIVILDPASLDDSLENICKAIKKAAKSKNIPILLISNTLKKAAVLEALNAGVTDFIHEPLNALEIHERIAVCLHSRLINKKMRMVQNKIKASPLVARNTKVLFEKTFIRDQTLKAITTAKKGTIPLSVLMIHLDSFLRLQETFGKKSLEDVFTFLESFFKKRLRKYDSFMKEAPGQYLILMPKTSQSAARVIANDIRKEISTTTIKTATKEILVTVSIGVVSFEKELSKSAKDFEQFDRCLERVKKSLMKAQKKGNTIISQT